MRALLKRRHIAQKQVPRGSRVEKWNQDFQRNFYRLLRLGRGKFESLEDQALALTNNTKSKHTKRTPKEALLVPDDVLAPEYNKGREKKKAYKAKPPKIGDKCRYLIKQRKNIRPMLNLGKHWNRLYKSYHGVHFTKQVYKIAAMTKQDPPRYYVNGSWKDRDELLIITGVDGETERQVAARAK